MSLRTGAYLHFQVQTLCTRHDINTRLNWPILINDMAIESLCAHLPIISTDYFGAVRELSGKKQLCRPALENRNDHN